MHVVLRRVQHFQIRIDDPAACQSKVDLLHLSNGDYHIEETGAAVADIGNRVVSANAYIGAQPIAEALANGADIVITGRAADPSHFVAPLIHELGWTMHDWHRLG
jgi:Acyclic terpene utilisation family protein AtuA